MTNGDRNLCLAAFILNIISIHLDGRVGMDVAPAGMDDPDDGDELGHLQGHAGQHRGVRCVQPAVREYHWRGGLLISNKER